jgi:class 3 adenylate cyclase
MEVPETHYAKVGNLRIAFQEFGTGERTVMVPPIISNIDVSWDHEFHRRMLEHLGSFLRVVQFDKRGIGLSDRFDDEPTLEERIEDIGAVMDAAGWETAHLFGLSEGADMAQLFAARYPHRVDRLALFGVAANFADAEQVKQLSGAAHREFEDISAEFMEVANSWGEDSMAFAKLLAPSQTGNEAYLRWANRLNRLAASPADFMRQLVNVGEIVGSLEPERVQAPTIIVQLLGDRVRTIGNARLVAQRIPDCTLAEVEGTDHLMYSLENWREVLDPIIEFLTGIRPPLSVQRRFAAVMFTDIVGSTTLSSSIGDLRYKELIEEHDLIAHRLTQHNRGRVVKSTGDGILAVFDSPSAAVTVASSLRTALEEIGLIIRVGIHAGEIEEHADRDISGLAVNLAARVEHAASDGSIFVSSTMKDLLLGGGIEFENRGEHTLKGIEGTWTLYEVS